MFQGTEFPKDPTSSPSGVDPVDQLKPICLRARYSQSEAEAELSSSMCAPQALVRQCSRAPARCWTCLASARLGTGTI